jgi:hypothetical protein
MSPRQCSALRTDADRRLLEWAGAHYGKGSENSSQKPGRAVCRVVSAAQIETTISAAQANPLLQIGGRRVAGSRDRRFRGRTGRDWLVNGCGRRTSNHKCSVELQAIVTATQKLLDALAHILRTKSYVVSAACFVRA